MSVKSDKSDEMSIAESKSCRSCDLDDSDSDGSGSMNDDDEFDSNVEDSDTEANMQIKKTQVNKNERLFSLKKDDFEKEYDERYKKLMDAKNSGSLTGGQYTFEQKLLDLEFREISHLREISDIN